jgi:hypothetical protein
MPALRASCNPPKNGLALRAISELLADADHRGLDKPVKTSLSSFKTNTQLIYASTFTSRNSRMPAKAFKTSSKAG